MQRGLVGLLEPCSRLAWTALVPAVRSDAFQVKLFILCGVSWNQRQLLVNDQMPLDGSIYCGLEYSQS